MDDYSVCLSYMAPDERELWSGAPGAGHLLNAADTVMIPFSIFWCGFAFFWEYTAIRSGATLLFALFGLPFVAVGIYFAFGRFIHAAYLRKKTCYIITDRRIIRKRGNKVDFLDAKMTRYMQVRTFSDGRGTISFDISHMHHHKSTAVYFALENIADVARVQQIISTMDK